MSNQAPLTVTIQARVASLAVGVDAVEAVAQAAWAGTITAATYTPDATITGANTNSRTLTIVNETQTLTAGTLALVSGTNITAETAGAITLSGTAANVTFNAGDVIAFVSTHVGTGIADPGGLVQFTLSRS